MTIQQNGVNQSTQGATGFNVFYNNNAPIPVPAGTTAAQAFEAMKNINPELSEKGAYEVLANGDVRCYLQAQNKSIFIQHASVTHVTPGSDVTPQADQTPTAQAASEPQGFNVFYNNNAPIPVPAGTTAAQAFEAMKNINPELAEKGAYEVLENGDVRCYLQAQNKSVKA